MGGDETGAWGGCWAGSACRCCTALRGGLGWTGLRWVVVVTGQSSCRIRFRMYGLGRQYVRIKL